MNNAKLFILLLLASQNNINTSEDTNATDGKDLWVTVFIHGSFSLRPHLNFQNIIKMLTDSIEESVYYRSTEINRRDPFFYKNQAIAGLGLHRIDIDHPHNNAAAPILAASFEEVSKQAGNPPSNQYYTFGWSGLVSNKLRYLESAFLHQDLEALIKKLINEGYRPKIRLIGYSHGGNLALQLGALHTTKPITKQFGIDELLLIGTPIQVETDYLINSPIFKKVYNFYSRADHVQTLDFFSFKRFFSRKKFSRRHNFTLPKKLTQIRIKITEYEPKSDKCVFDTLPQDPKVLKKHFKELNYDPGHFELWFMGWTILTYRTALSIVSLWGILLAQIVASKSLFLGLRITDPYVLISCWMFLIFYSMLGGLHSIVIVDIVQVLFITGVFSFSFLSMPSAASTMANLPRLALIQDYFYDVKPDLWSFLPILFIPTLFALIEQDLAQKLFAAKTRATATISALLAGLFLIAFSIIPIFYGILAKIKHVVIPEGGSPLVATLFFISSKTVFMLAMCGIMAAITSTASSLLCAISSNVVQDFSAFLPLENHKLTTTRFISFLIGTSALIMSFYMSGDILYILENSYRISVICLFVPTVIAYFATSLYKQAAWTSVLFGIIGLIGVQYYPMSLIMKDVIPLALSLSGYICAYVIVWTKKQLSL